MRIGKTELRIYTAAESRSLRADGITYTFLEIHNSETRNLGASKMDYRLAVFAIFGKSNRIYMEYSSCTSHNACADTLIEHGCALFMKIQIAAYEMQHVINNLSFGVPYSIGVVLYWLPMQRKMQKSTSD